MTGIAAGCGLPYAHDQHAGCDGDASASGRVPSDAVDHEPFDGCCDEGRVLSQAERGVALALYRHGGGQLDREAFDQALDADPLAQDVARAVTPIVADAVRGLTALMAPPARTPSGGDGR